ncbi:DNA primase [Corynebacterium kroppenstedtii]|uniref:DNA primase n=1 Tax=Corynebacterium sp. PCR 32 TaxID=3351342 RepID=UPI0030B38756
MARGRIPESDIDVIRERTPIEDVVGEYVQLKPAGSDSLKGLSPFKDEKTPSFHVRPNKGYYHCFSTGKGGDVFSFLMEMEQVSFPEAVEQCAERIGYQITYEGGGPGRREEPGTRQRLIAINRATQEFYQTQLATDDAAAARQFLLDRGFSKEHADQFGCGYAPGGWDTVTKHLLRKGFDVKELEAAGVTSRGRRGPIDRFHRRLTWPIRNTANDVIGFGARKLFDDDKLGKYMNTPETLLYKKSKVLFGIDLAKKNIAERHQAVIVEGYTDVMAMHAAGVTTAVAACGTAFGADHLQMVRRLMLDDSHFRGEMIYTFDGDEAGQKAAMRAFEGNQEFLGKSFVSVAPEGKDPCDLRVSDGDAAVRDLVMSRIPMLEFVVRTTLASFDLHTTEGRLQAMEAVAPAVASVKDVTLRKAYARKLSGWLGWDDVSDVEAAVHRAARRPKKSAVKRGRVREQQARGVGVVSGVGQQSNQPRFTRPNPRNGELAGEREALKIALQEPAAAAEMFDVLPAECFRHPTYREVSEGIRRAGGCAAAVGAKSAVTLWVSTVIENLPQPMGESMVTELMVEPIHYEGEGMEWFVHSTLMRLQAVWVGSQIAELKSTLERLRPSDEEYNTLFGDLVALEQYRTGLVKQATQRPL